jgi:hypothetical protein
MNIVIKIHPKGNHGKTIQLKLLMIIIQLIKLKVKVIGQLYDKDD